MNFVGSKCRQMERGGALAMDGALVYVMAIVITMYIHLLEVEIFKTLTIETSSLNNRFFLYF